MFFTILKAIGDPNHHVNVAILERLGPLLGGFRRTIDKNLWLFLEALCPHIAGANIEISKLAGGVLERSMDEWLLNPIHLVSVLCNGVTEGNSKVRHCVLDILTSKLG